MMNTENKKDMKHVLLPWSKKVFIFDLDGTLLNTLDDLTASTNHAMECFHFPTHSTNQVRQMVGNGVGKLIERAVPQGTPATITEQVLSTFRQHYATHCRVNTCPYQGIQQTLDALHEKGVRMAIVSNKPDGAVKELAAHFFPSYIEVAQGETPQIRRKPAPDMLLHVMEQMNVNAEDTLYIGDSDVDIQLAQAAHVPCLSVCWGFRDDDFLMEHGATTLIHAPHELLQTEE